MPKEFIMRGKTASGGTEKLEFGGQARPGYGYRITEFQLFPSSSMGSDTAELVGTITAGTTAVSPPDQGFDDDGLIASFYGTFPASQVATGANAVINDLFIITQDLILMVQDTANNNPINWQCRFEEIKLSTAGEAVANFKQYTIYNTSS